MADATYANSGAASNGTVSTVSAAVPASVAAGDLMIVAFYLDGITASVSSLPAGFAALPGTPVTAVAPFNHQLHVYGKRASGADSGTYDFVITAAVFSEWQAHRFTPGRASGTFWDSVHNEATNTTSSNTSPAVSMNTTEDSELLLHAATCWAGGTWTPPTGFTKIMQPAVGLCTLSYKLQATAGATGSLTATSTNSDKQSAWVGALLSSAARNKGGDFMPFFQ